MIHTHRPPTSPKTLQLLPPPLRGRHSLVRGHSQAYGTNPSSPNLPQSPLTPPSLIRGRHSLVRGHSQVYGTYPSSPTSPKPRSHTVDIAQPSQKPVKRECTAHCTCNAVWVKVDGVQFSEMWSGLKMVSPPGFLCNTDKEIQCILICF